MIIWFSLGYLKPSADIHFGSSTNSFGTPGAGGSFGFADPDAEIGYAYGIQEIPRVPTETTDQRLDMIVTEGKILYTEPEG